MQFLNRRAIAAYVLIVFLVALMTGCGGGGQSSADKKAALTVTQVDLFPAPSISLQPGDVTQLFAQALNSSGNQVFTQTITFNSSNSKIQIGTFNGQTLLCAGTWDNPSNAVVCTPTTTVPDTSNITASAGGVTSPTTVASIHVAVANVTVVPQITPPLTSIPPCVNEGKTQIYKAVARDINGIDITSTVGTFSWSSSQINVATIPATGDTGFTDQATATAVHPGDSNIIARIGTVTQIASTKSVFEQCLVTSIKVTVPAATPAVANDSPTHFEIGTGVTRALTVEVRDSTNTVLTTLPTLSWNSTQPAVANVSGTGSVTSVSPGTVGISASCLPDNCNIGTHANVTSNLVTGTITGTASTSATAYVTCTDPTAAGACNTGTLASPQVKLIPMNGTTLGTAITLPHVPNSMMINQQNSRVYLGSTPNGSDTSAGLMVVDANANTLSSTVTNAPGKVLAVAPNGDAVVTSNNADVFIYNGSTVTTLSDGINHVTGATAAAFSPDSGKLLVTTSAGNVWFQVPGVTPSATPLGGTPSDISFLPSGTFAIAATSSGLIPVQTCDQTVGGTLVGGNFDHVVGVPTDDSATPPNAVDSVVATLAPDIHRVDFTITGTGTPPGCPFNLTAADNTATTAGFTANELVLSPDSTHAFVISGIKVIDYNIASNSFTSVTLSTVNGTPDAKSGGVAASGALYAGGGADNSVHLITAGVEGTPIRATIPADLVVAKSH